MAEQMLLIVNPNAAGGAAGKRWRASEQRLRDLLPPFDVALTEGPGHATHLAREGARCHHVVVAVGGDGTLNEVVNGLMADGRPLHPDVALGMLPLGTGGDFVRTFGMSHDLRRVARRLAAGRRRQIDVGVVRFGPPNRRQVRYFLNEAEAGMGAAVCATLNAGPKEGGQQAYLRAILLTAQEFRPRELEFRIDGNPPERVLINNVWIANGQWSGAGMRSAPRAVPDDGLLDVVMVGETPPDEQGPHQLARLRNGTFVDSPWVRYQRGRRIEIRSQIETPIETDGEPIGVLPAVFEVCEGRLTVIC